MSAAEQPLSVLMLQIGVIIGVAHGLGALMRRVPQPQVVGEVVAGILLGPSFLGWLAPGVWAALFPPQVMPRLAALADVGIILFMFLVGLEVSPRLLRERGRSAVAISVTSMVVPFTLGAAVALPLHPALAPAHVSPFGFAGFVGAAMSITAFPVLARILIERNLLRSRLGQLALTCAAVDDVAGWCLLAIVAAAGPAHGAVVGLQTIGALAIYVAIMVAVVRPLLRPLAALHSRRGAVSQDLLAIVLVLVLASALATQWIGIHAIFGAFLLGAMMPKDSSLGHELSDKIEDFATVFFLPLYFGYTGLRTQIGLLDSPTAWLQCLLLMAVAVAGKFGGGSVAARVSGLSWGESAAVGALLNTRGLMELIILNVGLELGLITPAMFAMMVLMALVTTAMTAPALVVIGRATASR